jgi:hypothetical protein
MSFETTNLLLNLAQLGVLLAIVLRLHHTFNLIANTQRELRRAIHHLGDRRGAERGVGDRCGSIALASISPAARTGADGQFEPMISSRVGP